MHTNIWTLKREEPQEGTWEGNWMKKALPAVGGKSLWGRFIYLGLYRHNSKQYSGSLGLHVLKRSWTAINLRPECRIMAINN
jgi:hypothetical protein